MKFTRLRLSGFKTFLDASEVVIEAGLTGIVGPNGCGKSNLVESLRWVMGESSYKSMRGSGMDDVIFSGGGSRPARNSAEVSLTIDNSDRRAPAQFNAAETIEVVRRIEREAGSVYRVNGKEVRARDVQLLFADASTGAHSTAMVRQGQIAEIIAAKPQSRRRVLEEAAGISGLHSRRHEAELRLRGAEQNLDRLEDVVSQLSAQIEALSRQARQAARYRKLSADIRRHETVLWYLKRKQALAQLQGKLAEVRAAHLAVADLSKEAAAAATTRARAAADLPKLRQLEADRAAALRHLTVTRDEFDRERERLVARSRELQERLSQTEADLQREEHAAASTKHTIEALDAEAVQLKAAGEAAEAGRPALDEALGVAQAELSDVEATLAEATRAAADLAARRKHLLAAVHDRQNGVSRLERQAADVARELERLRASVAEADLDRLESASRKAAEAQEEAEAAASEADAAAADARRAEGEARGPVQAAEQELGSLRTERDTIARILASEWGGASASVLDEIRVEKGYEAALGAAFGEDLDRSADEADAIHWRELGPHEGDPPLPDGVTPLSDHVEAPRVLARRLAMTGIVDADRGAALQPRLAAGQCLVSRAGDLWRWDGFTAGADAPTAAARRLQQKNRIAELDLAMAVADRRLGAAREALKAAQDELRSREKTAADARSGVKPAQQTARQAAAAHGEAIRRMSQVTARLDVLAEQQVSLGEDLKAAREAHAQAAADLEALPPDAGEEARLDTLRRDVAAARGRVTDARGALDAHARDAQARASRAQAIATERARWQERAAQSGEHAGTLRRRREEIGREFDDLSGKPDELRRQREKVAEEIEKAETERRKAADALAAGESSVSEADRVAHEAEASLSKAREVLAREEATVEGLRDRLSDLDRAAEDQLGMPLAAALRRAGVSEDEPLPDTSAVEAELDRGRRERARLGSVNLRAEEEMQEVRSRHDGLVAEREDLLQAIAKLRAAIQSLNREGRERLLASFEVVNGHFQALFTRLFGGGDAELQLTESDDPLEAGLEIVARPPGKRPQVLTLLSGGEQALTAMALIFAVFLTNPAPICVLDEVDAPLDDANVERFCDLMEEMARQTETRFLIITHNPITMARMNRLFGVTMAERGISQLVSVDIDEAQAMREAS
ncbi:chromosome segregation SMC family protein [Lutibaculum baratangense]|uniref:Chromosome partition protein Smc n=1 Tax=Lutibaculum baratangense AMV1 TaxID=631454 RepID=V4TJZ4_9HYPH|nr:AAA family ATPase [Lutibaculum baratangense]ESR26213.1 Chromosome partition protein smc [Lutibaculum baratangense AMV1]